jgi:hypothetical protein
VLFPEPVGPEIQIITRHSSARCAADGIQSHSNE